MFKDRDENGAGNSHILHTQLEQYAAQGLYPFHMPGHKRRMQPAPGLPISRDMTEVPGTDDLHDADGILLEAMRRTAALCGADRTWYLVNGSTCGLLAGIHALAGPGSEVICARNCHKAVYHAIGLAGYRVHWVMPSLDGEWGICGGISAAQIRAELRRHPFAAAVILTSPTYEGILSEVEEICGICHKKGIPVLVDEAHGAHLLPVSERAGFPKGAAACGADIVVQSPHKTLPSLTQTALLHLNGTLVEPWRIEEGLDLFETSSPSYLLMESLDGCTGILREQGEALFAGWAARLARFAAAVRCLRRIRIHGITGDATGDAPAEADTSGEDHGGRPAVGSTPAKGAGGFPAAGSALLSDPGKILIDARGTGMSGAELARLLREQYRMETEMASGSLVLAMTSICDEEDALDRLAAALLEIDENIEKDKNNENGENIEKDKNNENGKIDENEEARAFSEDLSGTVAALAAFRPTPFCSISQAMGQMSEPVSLEQTPGRISAGYLLFYPPGIPFLAPGEVIPSGMAQLLAKAFGSGMSVRGISRDGTLRCLRE